MKRHVLFIAGLLCLGASVAAFGPKTDVLVSSDPYTNATSFHKTEVEPDTYSYGNTIVSAFQVGRFADGGANDIGWATSTDGGATWQSGFLPGITKYQNGGAYDRVSDASVAYDAAHKVWLVSSLTIYEPNISGAAVVVNRSPDGIHWDKAVPVSVATQDASYDKNWTVCDDSPTSAFYGHCYTEWDDNGSGNTILMSTSADGGLTWSVPQPTADQAAGLGGQPVVQPNGTVIVPIGDGSLSQIMAFVSKDGGQSWSATVPVSDTNSHEVAAEIRTEPLPSAEIDGQGKVFLVWQDCRFETDCSANDLVMSTSVDGVQWTEPVRLPLDPIGSDTDHFIPGLAVDKSTSGSNAHLTVTYYMYPKADCADADCELYVASSTSLDGGNSWSKPAVIAGPISPSKIPQTTQGGMVGDYISTSYAGGRAFTVFPALNGTDAPSLDMMASQALPLSSSATVPVENDAVLSPALARVQGTSVKPLTMR